MKAIRVGKLGLAFGITGILFYLGCMFLMAVAGAEGTARVFNSLLHGLDTSQIIRMDIPWWESLAGMAATFLLAWIAGALTGAFYNWLTGARKAAGQQQFEIDA